MTKKSGLVCCGRDCKTDFCPHCGRDMGVNPLESLLEYCVRMRDKARDRDDGSPAVVGRWIRWATALEKVLKKPGGAK